MFAVEPYQLSLCDALHAASQSDKGRVSLKTALKDFYPFWWKKKSPNNQTPRKQHCFFPLLREERMKILK